MTRGASHPSLPPDTPDVGSTTGGAGGQNAAMEALLSDHRALLRARRALACLPFRRAFYDSLREGSLAAGSVARGGPAAELCFAPLSADQAEDHFLWLIRLGVLRREVDGQGLTGRVRLTPMGRQLLDGLPAEVPRAGPWRRLRGFCSRHRPRLP
ncbi:MAG: hypothetical protein VKK62_04930 [Synechococcaceae cyanobacterium]|nr:hypothetical protein [Synechococcaceae cyanobacterium]